VTSEHITNLGRIGLVWKYENKVFIIEMKFVDRFTYVKTIDEKTDEPILKKKARPDEDVAKEIDEKVEAALAQIKDKKYYERYTLAKKEVILVGLVVTTKSQDVKAKFERL
jgi:hypothetical protein